MTSVIVIAQVEVDERAGCILICAVPLPESNCSNWSHFLFPFFLLCCKLANKRDLCLKAVHVNM